MIDVAEDIDSLSDFKRHTAERIEKMKTTGRPLILTVNGKAEVVVQSAAAYQKLLEQVQYWETVEAVRKGLEAAERGEARPLDQVMAELRQKHGLPG